MIVAPPKLGDPAARRTVSATADASTQIIAYYRGQERVPNSVVPIVTGPGQVTLELSNTKITDKGLKELVGELPHLRTLSLFHTAVTDAGLQELLQLEVSFLCLIVFDKEEQCKTLFYLHRQSFRFFSVHFQLRLEILVNRTFISHGRGHSLRIAA